MIVLKNISKTYNCGSESVNALKDINLEISDGEFVFVLGKSGSGKTTLLNIIGLLDSYTDGNYILKDTDVSDISAAKKEKLRKDNIGFVFQHFELLNNYTAYENIEMPLIPRNIKRKERKLRVNEYAEKLEISELLDKFPDEMSGGQQQRVAIARALITGNNIILADEPTGALDSKTSEMLMEVFSDINKMGKTIICVTHNEDLIRYGSRVIYLEDGCIVDDKKSMGI